MEQKPRRSEVDGVPWPAAQSASRPLLLNLVDRGDAIYLGPRGARLPSRPLFGRSAPTGSRPSNGDRGAYRRLLGARWAVVSSPIALITDKQRGHVGNPVPFVKIFVLFISGPVRFPLPTGFAGPLRLVPRVRSRFGPVPPRRLDGLSTPVRDLAWRGRGLGVGVTMGWGPERAYCLGNKVLTGLLCEDYCGYYSAGLGNHMLESRGRGPGSSVRLWWVWLRWGCISHSWRSAVSGWRYGSITRHWDGNGNGTERRGDWLELGLRTRDYRIGSVRGNPG